MKKIKFIFECLILLTLLTSCNQSEAYFSYIPVEKEGWDKQKHLAFNYNNTDTTSLFNVFIHVRHHGNYPYQNFWIFLEETTPKGTITKDTIECYLANDYGKWLGNGYSIKEIPISYKQGISFPDSGKYQLRIYHGMRDSILTGIKDIGVRIEPAINRNNE